MWLRQGCPPAAPEAFGSRTARIRHPSEWTGSATQYPTDAIIRQFGRRTRLATVGVGGGHKGTTFTQCGCGGAGVVGNSAGVLRALCYVFIQEKQEEEDINANAC